MRLNTVKHLYQTIFPCDSGNPPVARIPTLEEAFRGNGSGRAFRSLKVPTLFISVYSLLFSGYNS